MSDSFTPHGDATWQTLLNEITLAYSERRQSILQTSYTASAGKDVQLATYWSTLQLWLETEYLHFIDHINGPLNVGDYEFLYFTLSSWQSAAGLNTSAVAGESFRRSSDGATFTYGFMQEGDVIGPWIFEDLQGGFGALRWLQAGMTSSAVMLNGASWILTSTAVLEFFLNILDLPLDVSVYAAIGAIPHTHVLFQEFSKGGTTSWAGSYDTQQPDSGSFDSPEGLAKWNFTNA